MISRGATLLAAVWITLLAAIPANAGQPSCAFPPDLALTGQSLPKVAAAIAGHLPLTILAIGGSSTAGNAAGGAAYTYPARLAEHLRARLPDSAVTVINRGKAGGQTGSRVDRIDEDLAQTKPTLVIWAPGSTEAGLSEDVSLLEARVREGAAKIEAAQADLILIDLQYAPSIARVIDLERYNEIIAGVAQSEQVPLLRRSALMRYWNDNGVFDLDGTPAAQRVATIRRLFDCLAMGLADTIVTAVP